MQNSIVVLDGYTLAPAGNDEAVPPGEPSWDRLSELGTLVVHPRTPANQVASRIADASIVLTNKTVLGHEELRSARKLTYVGVMATGVNVVDLDAARQAGITVTNVPGYGTDSVAQHVFALLLELTNQVAAHANSVRQGRWAACPDFSYTLSPLVELAGKTLGIVGLGTIGQRVAVIGHALGMKIAASHQRSMDQIDIPGVPVRWMELDELVEHADVLTLHCPLTDATRHMINPQRLSRMKARALLINTGRGPLIDESALAEALHAGRIGGAAVDVLSEEPPQLGSPLVGAPGALVTPHIAWATQEARRRLMDEVAENIDAFLNDQPRNVVGQ